MPETAIDEQRDPQPWPREVGFTSYWPMLPIPAQAVRPKETPHRLFGGLVAERFDRRHDLRPRGFRYGIH